MDDVTRDGSEKEEKKLGKFFNCEAAHEWRSAWCKTLFFGRHRRRNFFSTTAHCERGEREDVLYLTQDSYLVLGIFTTPVHILSSAIPGGL